MENQAAAPQPTDALYRFLGQLDNAIRDIIAALPAGAWLLFALIGVVAMLSSWLLLRSRRHQREAAKQAREAAERAAFEARLAESNRVLDSELGELRGRLAAMADTSSARHNELAGAISSEQLRLSEALTQRLDLVTAWFATWRPDLPIQVLEETAVAYRCRCTRGPPGDSGTCRRWPPRPRKKPIISSRRAPIGG